MKPIDYYTTISKETAIDINSTSIAGKLFLIRAIANTLYKLVDEVDFEIQGQTIIELSKLNDNQALGVIKALADQCQHTLISPK